MLVIALSFATAITGCKSDDASYIDIDASDCTLKYGQTLTVIDLSDYEDDEEVLVLPAIYATMDIVSSAPSVVSVDGFVLKAVGVGDAEISIYKDQEHSKLIKAFTVHVDIKYEFNADKYDLKYPESVDFLNILEENIPASVLLNTWTVTSSDESVATVKESTIKAVGLGEANIEIRSKASDKIIKTIPITVAPSHSIAAFCGETIDFDSFITDYKADYFNSTDEDVVTSNKSSLSAKFPGHAYLKNNHYLINVNVERATTELPFTTVPNFGDMDSDKIVDLLNAYTPVSATANYIKYMPYGNCAQLEFYLGSWTYAVLDTGLDNEVVLSAMYSLFEKADGSRYGTKLEFRDPQTGLYYSKPTNGKISTITAKLQRF